ncbi:hypothetical protein CPB83DRAFT_360171 [Crepidotus variabilis]|uniref:Uncharacterized protein n=1 Tax=Crepidotus variabilis TaxID=179855 RepID=A0A9P6EFJ0_9AGAR|nr:hypothetical protein CPB83DRAFT_360171 [Crepidotus variabilis]
MARLNLNAAPSNLRLLGNLEQFRIQNWDNLVHLDVANTSLSVCGQIFRDAPNLVSCSLRESWLTTTATHTAPFEYSSLQKLALFQVGLAFWDLFTLPALRELSISESLEGDDEDRTSFNNFLVRSKCPLEAFKFSEFRSSEEGFIRILDHVPNISRLKFRYLDLSDLFFHHISVATSIPGDVVPLLGNLMAFEYDFPSEHAFTWPAVAHFVSLRCGGRGVKDNLRSVKLRAFATSVVFPQEEVEAVIEVQDLGTILEAANGIELSIRDTRGNVVVKHDI